ncbi:hypothetical protein [Streptomyces sp. NPDC007369]|uniref:hypothetical protein n=1 Tax=Streptomyces sp. NPDC007369 TaxID=3154589 RepID=UPI0033C1437F
MYFDENEPQAVRDERLAAQRARLRALRNSAPVDVRDAHVGVLLVALVLVVLGLFGMFAAPAVVGGLFLLWFATALIRVHVDGDRGRHAVRRAYRAAFGWIKELPGSW